MHQINLGNRITERLLLLVLTALILYAGRQLFIPLSYGLLISFILYPLCKWMEVRGMSRSLAIFIGVAMVVVFFLAMLLLLGWQFKSFLNEWPLISDKFTKLLNDLQNEAIRRFGISEKQWADWENQLLKGSGNSLQNLGSSISNFFVNLVMLFIIPVFSFLILYYRQRLLLLFYGFFPPEMKAKLAEVIRLSIHTYYNFIKGMLLVYFLVGMLNSIGLLLLGVPHAILFGFLTAIMTFIPYVGIIVASLLPITYAWITYNSVWYPLGVIGIFAFVQYLEANVIFPWAVGHRLQLNTLITLIVIVAGGILWGASGMILFVPFAAIAKLMADRMEGWAWLSVLLGDEEPKKKSKES